LPKEGDEAVLVATPGHVGSYINHLTRFGSYKRTGSYKAIGKIPKLGYIVPRFRNPQQASKRGGNGQLLTPSREAAYDNYTHSDSNEV
jgi:hypothetical protein